MGVTKMSPLDQISRAGLILLSCAVVGFTIVGRSFSWLTPGMTDAQCFAYIGLAWLDGRLPYIDVWDIKPPGIFALNAAVFAILPNSFGALAIVEGFSIIACALTVYSLLRQWRASQVGAALGTLTFAITSNLLFYNDQGNLTEIYVLLPATLSVYCFSRSFPDFTGKWMFLAGFCAGIASMFKLPGIASLLAQTAFLVLVWILSPDFSLSRLLAGLLTILIGVAIAWLPVCFYFAYHDALVEMVNASLIYLFNYGLVHSRSLTGLLLLSYENLHRVGSIYIFVFVGLCTFVLGNRDFVARMQPGKTPTLEFFLPLAALWLLVDLIAALAGGRNHQHYFLCLMPSLSVMAGVTFGILLSPIGESASAKPIQLCFFAVLVVPLVLYHFENDFREFVHLIKYRHLLSHDKRFGHYAPTMNEQLKNFQTYMRTIKDEKDTLFSVEYQPWIFTTLNMKSSVYVMDADYRKQFTGALRRRFGPDLLRLLEANPPVFIADTTDEPEAAGEKDSFYREFTQFINNRYEFVTEFVLSSHRVRLYKIVALKGDKNER
jgi:Dolichyl-phosphate-mannose-protein mannosyltransferase